MCHDWTSLPLFLSLTKKSQKRGLDERQFKITSHLFDKFLGWKEEEKKRRRNLSNKERKRKKAKMKNPWNMTKINVWFNISDYYTKCHTKRWVINGWQIYGSLRIKTWNLFFALFSFSSPLVFLNNKKLEQKNHEIREWSHKVSSWPIEKSIILLQKLPHCIQLLTLTWVVYWLQIRLLHLPRWQFMNFPLLLIFMAHFLLNY